MTKILWAMIACHSFIFSASAQDSSTVNNTTSFQAGAGGDSVIHAETSSKSATGTAIVAQQAVPVLKQIKPIRLQHFALPAGLISVGVVCALSKDAAKMNELAKNGVYTQGNEHRFGLDNYTMLAPAVAVYGLNLAGVRGKNNLLDRTMILTMSALICNGITTATKDLAKVRRPDGSDLQSFPSGHTANAFVAAEFMRMEYKDVSPWIAYAGYVTAAGTGLLRMYHNKHWFNDVVTGAGVGILSTRLSYWLYPKIKQALFPKAKSSVMIAPSMQNGGYGISLAYGFR